MTYPSPTSPSPFSPTNNYPSNTTPILPGFLTKSQWYPNFGASHHITSNVHTLTAP